MRYIGILAALLFVAQCTSETEDNTGLALAALAIASPNCTVGNQAFFANGEVNCSSGTSATATGTAFLSAATTHGDVLSLQVTIDVADTGTTSVRVQGHGTGSTANSASFIEVNGSSNTTSGGASNTSGASTGVADAGDGTYCIEFHSETEVHAIYRRAACTSIATTSADWDSEGTSGNGNTVTTGAPSGNNWGITLVNASVSGLTVNSDEQFTD
jgi:hypothetical protein